MSQHQFAASFTKVDHLKTYPAIDPSQPSLSAAGKTVLVTAGHTGIGYAISNSFAVAGASRVILLARRAEVLEEAVKELSSKHPGTQFQYYPASITDHDRVKEVFVDIRKETGEVNILVTSAAKIEAGPKALEVEAEQLRDSFETNVMANVNLVHEFVVGATQKNSPKIILDVSTSAAHIAIPKSTAYGMSKAAFSRFLMHVQQDYEAEGVRVHSFHPGSIMTDAAKSVGFSEEDFHYADVQLAGDFAVWLASDEAGFLKGRLVWSEWDVEALKAKKADFEKDPTLLTLGLIGMPETAVPLKPK
ncbi:MAG: hypothetical protein M1833_000186 [Piccolia ochrophora]|nr:MAG: hypothetical protein M1833_000186 [Piccolia ochrophora]